MGSYHVIGADERIVDSHELHIVPLKSNPRDQTPDPSESCSSSIKKMKKNCLGERLNYNSILKNPKNPKNKQNQQIGANAEKPKKNYKKLTGTERFNLNERSRSTNIPLIPILILPICLVVEG